MAAKAVVTDGLMQSSGKLQTAKITEKLVKDKIKKIIDIFSKYNAIYTLTPMTMGYGESGHPDRLLLINGVLVGAEAKKDCNNHHCRPSLKPKPNEVMQKKQAQKITDAGGAWVCIHNDNLPVLITTLDKYALHKSHEFSDSDRAELDKLMGI